jgi:hypothetical protein
MAKDLFLGVRRSGETVVGGIWIDDDGVVIIPKLSAEVFTSANVAEGAQASVSDGGTISHTLTHTPQVILLTGTVAGETVTYSSVDGTHITVAIKKPSGDEMGEMVPGTTQTVSWRAVYQP